MHRRQPSGCLTFTDRSSIRRRSGRLSPGLTHGSPATPPPGSSIAPRQFSEQTQCANLIVQVEDTDATHSQPTVILVRPSLPSPPLPPLPAFNSDAEQNHDDRLAISEITQPEGEREQALFSPVPLTPRPDAPARATSDASLKTNETFASQMSLPIPDFTARKSVPSNPFRALFTRGLSFISRGPPVVFLPPSAPLESSERPQSFRSESDSSERSSCSVSSCGTSSSVDTGHLSLIPSVGTTDKFTHKWPKPRSLGGMDARSMGNRSGARLGQAAALALEEGQGLGMNKVERWSSYKWCLLLSVASVFVYGAVGLVCAILTWFRTWSQADVMYIADSDILILITLASSILLFTASMGTTGVLLNSRPILAVYALLLWPAFISILAIGYIAYKRSAFSLDHKLNLAWSRYFTPLGRLIIQNSLNCCGFYNAMHDATPGQRCYPRTPLPGCKGKLYSFERANLTMIWSAAFALVPLHIVNMITALLCANHITNTFGKGITPKKYRLSGMDLKTDAERISSRLGTREIRPVVRPELSRTSSSGIFREDREERMSLLGKTRW